MAVVVVVPVEVVVVPVDVVEVVEDVVLDEGDELDPHAATARTHVSASTPAPTADAAAGGRGTERRSRFTRVARSSVTGIGPSSCGQIAR